MALFDWIKRKFVGSNGIAITPNRAPLEPISEAYSPPADQGYLKSKAKPSAALLKYAAPGWLLSTRAGEGEPRASRIGGRPYMGTNEHWPHCGACEKPLSHLLQYDLEALSEKGFDHGTGLIRLFYCESEECVGMAGWAAHDPQHHVSILHGLGACRDIPEGTKNHPATQIFRFEQVADIPHWEDHPDRLQEEDVDPYQGHKFGGWPFWIQGPERPNCALCKSEMNTIIQLDESQTSSFNFGGGIGHISRCTDHPDQLAFAWACT